MKTKQYKSATMRYAIQDGVFWASYTGVLDINGLALFLQHPMPEGIRAVAHRVDGALTALPIGVRFDAADVWPVDGCVLCRPDQYEQVAELCRAYAAVGSIRIPFVTEALACEWVRSRAAAA